MNASIPYDHFAMVSFRTCGVRGLVRINKTVLLCPYRLVKVEVEKEEMISLKKQQLEINA